MKFVHYYANYEFSRSDTELSPEDTQKAVISKITPEMLLSAASDEQIGVVPWITIIPAIDYVGVIADMETHTKSLFHFIAFATPHYRGVKSPITESLIIGAEKIVIIHHLTTGLSCYSSPTA